MSPREEEISLRHLPDSSDASFSFQIPNASSWNDRLLDEDDMSFLQDDSVYARHSVKGSPVCYGSKAPLTLGQARATRSALCKDTRRPNLKLGRKSSAISTQDDKPPGCANNSDLSHENGATRRRGWSGMKSEKGRSKSGPGKGKVRAEEELEDSSVEVERGNRKGKDPEIQDPEATTRQSRKRPACEALSPQPATKKGRRHADDASVIITRAIITRAPAKSSGSGSGSGSNGHARKQKRVPDLKVMLGRRKGVMPTVPLPFEFSTDARAREREKFEEHLRGKEREARRVLEEKRREEAEAEERAIRELRKKAVPRAHQVPEWYKDVPKRAS